MANRIDKGIVILLESYAAVVAAVDTDPNGFTRIYNDNVPDQVGQADKYITVNEISYVPVKHLTDGAGYSSGLYQIDCYAPTKDGSITIRRAIQDNLESQAYILKGGVGFCEINIQSAASDPTYLDQGATAKQRREVLTVFVKALHPTT